MTGQMLERDARMPNPVFALEGTFDALAAVGRAIDRVQLPVRLRDLVNIRASQLNRCGVCLVQHQREAIAHGMSQDEVFAIAGWQDAPHFTVAEIMVLRLTEAVTVLGVTIEDAVSDALWNDLSAEFTPDQLAALLVAISLVNFWNRVNRSTRQLAGPSW